MRNQRKGSHFLEVELGKKINLNEVKSKILIHFKDLFDVEAFESDI